MSGDWVDPLGKLVKMARVKGENKNVEGAEVVLYQAMCSMV